MAAERHEHLARLLAEGVDAHEACLEAGYPETTATWLAPRVRSHLAKAGVEIPDGNLEPESVELVTNEPVDDEPEDEPVELDEPTDEPDEATGPVLTARTQHYLDEAGVPLAKARKMTDEELSELNGIGPASIHEIRSLGGEATHDEDSTDTSIEESDE